MQISDDSQIDSFGTRCYTLNHEITFGGHDLDSLHENTRIRILCAVGETWADFTLLYLNSKDLSYARSYSIKRSKKEGRSCFLLSSFV
jgi:hypothetical protein